MSNLKDLSNEQEIKLFTSILIYLNDTFDSQPWTNRSQARTILNSAMKEVMSNPNRERALNYCQQLWRLLPNVKPCCIGDNIQEKI